jgi:hypothetical protein
VAVPWRIHTVFSDSSIQFADLSKRRMGPRLALVVALLAGMSFAGDWSSPARTPSSLR